MALKEKLKAESQETLKADGHNHNQAVRTAAAEKAAILYHTLDGVGFARSMKRVYPMGEKAGSVIGFANRYEGIDGLEHQLDPMLKGIDGKMYVTKDAQRHTLLVQDQRLYGCRQWAKRLADPRHSGSGDCRGSAFQGGDGAQSRQRHGDRDGPLHRQNPGDGQLPVL